MRVTRYLLKSLLPFLLGAGIAAELLGSSDSTQEATPQSAAQVGKQEDVVMKITEKYPDKIEKICHHRILVMQIHAPDGTYMEATETEFLNSYIDEPVSSARWITEK